MGFTTDPNHPELGRGIDDIKVELNKVYLVLSQTEIDKGFVKPYRTSYVHLTCNKATSINTKIAETYATDPYFYSSTYCCHCSMHRPLKEFIWSPDGESMDPGDRIIVDYDING